LTLRDGGCVLATGSVEADADEIRTIAEGMQARADGSG